MGTNRIVGLLLLGVCLGCGYSGESLIDPQYKTVYVETFDNLSFYRGFEYSLTRSLINEINSKTRLRVVDRDKAQTIITGRITDVTQRVLTEDLQDRVREMQVRVVVDMTWSDRATGRRIKAVRSLVGTEEIKFDIGETLETATPELFDDTAERLVEALEADW